MEIAHHCHLYCNRERCNFRHSTVNPPVRAGSSLPDVDYYFLPLGLGIAVSEASQKRARTRKSGDWSGPSRPCGHEGGGFSGREIGVALAVPAGFGGNTPLNGAASFGRMAPIARDERKSEVGPAGALPDWPMRL